MEVEDAIRNRRRQASVSRCNFSTFCNTGSSLKDIKVPLQNSILRSFVACIFRDDMSKFEEFSCFGPKFLYTAKTVLKYF